LLRQLVIIQDVVLCALDWYHFSQQE
jgi:hypothetical protein